MKRNLSRVLILALVGVLALSVSVAAKPIVLNYWTGFTGPDGQTMQQLVDQFNEEHKGEIEVRMSIMPWGNFYEKIVSAVLSGKAPDVAVMPVDRMAEFASRGVLLQLDQYVDEFGLEGSDYIDAVWKGGIYEGKRYSIPLDTHPMPMYWNKKLFREAGLDPESPPATREEFIEAARKLTKDTDGDGEIDQWGTMLSVGWPNFFYWYSIFYQNGGVLFNEDNTKALFNSEAGVDAMQFLYDCIYKYEISPPNVQTDAEHEAFKRGELGMTFNGIWMLNAYREQPGLEFGAGPIPQFGSERQAVWAGSHQFVLPKQRRPDQEKIQATLQFVRWLGEHSLDWGLGGQLPARLSVLNGTEFRQDPYLGTIAEMADHVYFPPFFPKYGEATGPIWEALNAVLLDKMSPKEALDRAVEQANKILSGR